MRLLTYCGASYAILILVSDYSELVFTLPWRAKSQNSFPETGDLRFLQISVLRFKTNSLLPHLGIESIESFNDTYKVGTFRIKINMGIPERFGNLSL